MRPSRRRLVVICCIALKIGKYAGPCTINAMCTCEHPFRLGTPPSEVSAHLGARSVTVKALLTCNVYTPSCCSYSSAIPEPSRGSPLAWSPSKRRAVVSASTRHNMCVVLYTHTRTTYRVTALAHLVIHRHQAQV